MCAGISRGTRRANAVFDFRQCSVLLMVTIVALVPALCRSFSRSPHVVLGFLLTVLMTSLSPRDEILREALDGGRWPFMFSILNNCSTVIYSRQAAYLS